METKTHHGNAVLEIAKQKGFNKGNLANAMNMSRQGLEYHLKRSLWNKETLEDFAKVLEIDAKEITSKIESESEGSNYKEKYFDLLEETKALWQLVAHHGIKVDLKNFNLGGLSSAFGDAYFFIGSTQKATHP